MILRELKEEDAPLMLECLSDINVNKYMNIDGSKMTIDNCINFIKNANSEVNKHFAIVDENNKYIGTISLKNIDLNNKSAEYAIITSSSVHGKGYAKKATDEILKKAFNDFKLNRIYLNVLKDNIKANRFYIKYGFILEGTFRESIFIKDRIYDLNWFSILKNEFYEKNYEIG